MFTGLIAKIAANAVLGRVAANAKSDWARIPPKVKLAIALAILLLVLFLVHQHVAHNRITAADKAGYDRRASEDAAALRDLRQRVRNAETNAATIAANERNKHEQAVHANAAAAGAILLHGPGAASCRFDNHPGLPAAAGGSGKAGGAADAALDPMPDGGGTELIALPFAGTVAFAQQQDDLRDEVIRWHNWYPKMVVEWAKLTAPAPLKKGK